MIKCLIKTIIRLKGSFAEECPDMSNEKDYKVMEWQEDQFIDHAKPLLNFGTMLNYVHKIKLNIGDNVYLVPEEFYDTAKNKNKEVRNGIEE